MQPSPIFRIVLLSAGVAACGGHGAMSTGAPASSPSKAAMACDSPHGLRAYGMGGRAPGTLPREGTRPGTTRSVGPSQGTLDPRARLPLEASPGATDRSRTEWIQRDLLHSPTLSPYAQIQVSTESGLTTLRGRVPSTHDRERVEQIAANYAGRSCVVNLVDVAPERSTPIN